MNIGSFGFTLLSFAVALGVLIFVHELGHFLVAKKLGVKVLRFSIGFGPVLFSWRKGETEYAISAVPMGGYVKMLGEEDEEEAQANPERAFSTQPVRRRGAIVFAGPAMNFVFAFFVYAILFVAVGVELPSNEPRVGGVSMGLPAERAGLQVGDRVLRVNGQDTNSLDDAQRSIYGAGVGDRIVLSIERGGRRFDIALTLAEAPRGEP